MLYEVITISSYAYVIRNNLWEELVIMMLHWVFFWGILLYQLGLGDAMLLMMEVTVLLSIWISAGISPSYNFV